MDGFDGKIVYKYAMFHCLVWVPEGADEFLGYDMVGIWTGLVQGMIQLQLNMIRSFAYGGFNTCKFDRGEL